MVWTSVVTIFGNSLHLNYAQHIGSIIKDKVEARMIAETDRNKFSLPTLIKHVTEVLKSFENDTELFETLLLSYPERLGAVRRANGGHTEY